MAAPFRLVDTPAWFDDPSRGCAAPGEVQFFPPDFLEHRRYSFDSKPAKKLCRACPFKNECLEWSLQTKQNYGVWGGMDEKQRRQIMRCRKGLCAKRCTHPYRQRRT